jgi:hypothetical protein
VKISRASQEMIDEWAIYLTCREVQFPATSRADHYLPANLTSRPNLLYPITFCEQIFCLAADSCWPCHGTGWKWFRRSNREETQLAQKWSNK